MAPARRFLLLAGLGLAAVEEAWEGAAQLFSLALFRFAAGKFQIQFLLRGNQQ